MRDIDLATQLAIRDRNKIIIRNLVTIAAEDSEGDIVRFGFTDWGEDIAINIIDGRTQAVVNRSYYGDNGPLLSIDPIPMQINIEIVTVQVSLSQINSAVNDMVRNHLIRGKEIQIHRAYLDAESMLPVANPRCRLLGIVNGAPVATPEADNVGAVTLRAVSHTRELTRINSALRSDETQRLRDGDRIRKYGGVAQEWEIFWGEEKA